MGDKFQHIALELALRRLCGNRRGSTASPYRIRNWQTWLECRLRCSEIERERRVFRLLLMKDPIVAASF